MGNHGIEVTLKELIDLRCKALYQSQNTKNNWFKLPGQKLARIRGRGIEFDATREYQAGDDIRNMAWRVTARSLKPHIKVYQEEKERPVWLAVDLSPSLYFGTRCMFKSVNIIKQAAFLGWAHLLQHERIGAMLTAEDTLQIYRPESQEYHFLNILNALAKRSSIRPNFYEKNYLQPLLLSLRQQIRSGDLIIIFSDFFQFHQEIQSLLTHIAARAQVMLFFIYDPIEAEPPLPHQYQLTDGREKAIFNMVNVKNRLQYQEQFQTKLTQLTHFSRKHHIALHKLCTDQKD